MREPHAGVVMLRGTIEKKFRTGSIETFDAFEDPLNYVGLATIDVDAEGFRGEGQISDKAHRNHVVANTPNDLYG
ncbi:hypothetical protein JCM15831A_27820 [Asaia astilbis]